MKVIARFNWDCGRMGNVEGLFVADKDVLEGSFGKSVYFGEILGKHSEVEGTLDREDITIVSEDQEFIARLEETVGSGTVSGYNPLSYLQVDDEDSDD